MSRAPRRTTGSLNVVDWVLGVCGAVAAFRAVVAQNRAPRPADPLPDDVVAARAKELQEKWARKGRYRAAGVSLVASVMTALSALIAASGATADEPAWVKLSAVFAVLAATVLRVLASLRPAGWKRWPWSALTVIVYVSLWLLVICLSAEMQSSPGYIITTLIPVVLLLAVVWQDEATKRGQADVPKTFREMMADAIPQKWRDKLRSDE